MEQALESLSGVSDVEVSRFPFLNGGSSWAITFADGSGPVEPLSINSTNLHGTGLQAYISEDTAGSFLGGTFRLYTNDGDGSRYLLGANETKFAEGRDDEETGRSRALAWNAPATDIEDAINDLFPAFAAQGGYIVQLAIWQTSVSRVLHPVHHTLA